MLEFPTCKDDLSMLKHIRAGGEFDDLSKMQRTDGERVAT